MSIAVIRHPSMCASTHYNICTFKTIFSWSCAYQLSQQTRTLLNLLSKPYIIPNVNYNYSFHSNLSKLFHCIVIQHNSFSSFCNCRGSRKMYASIANQNCDNLQMNNFTILYYYNTMSQGLFPLVHEIQLQYCKCHIT